MAPSNMFIRLVDAVFGFAHTDASVSSTIGTYDQKGRSETNKKDDPFAALPLPSAPRKRPMRVLPLGMLRTKEISLGEALKILGYTPFGMAEGLKQPAYIFPRWREAARAKFYPGHPDNLYPRPWGKDEFDAMLGEYDSVIGVPGCLYAEELIAAYPDVPVILVERESSQTWLLSMRRACALIRWPAWEFIAYWSPDTIGALWGIIKAQMGGLCGADFSDNGPAQAYYEKHNAMIKRLVPKERLLLFDNSMGWEPLCTFLGQPVPDVPFPQSSDDEDDGRIILFQRLFWVLGLTKGVLSVAGIVALPVVLGWAAWNRDTVLEKFSPMILEVKQRLWQAV